MEINGNVFIVIVGGYYRCYYYYYVGTHYDDEISSSRINFGTDLVEILNISKPNEGWVKGPKLPFEGPLSASIRGMFTSPSGKGVILNVGQQFIELSGNSIEQLTWKILDHKLQISRFGHVAFPIPNDTGIMRTIEERKRQN